MHPSSRDGASHSGLYVASSWLLDMAQSEREVDVFDTVRRGRGARPQLIPDLVIALLLYCLH